MDPIAFRARLAREGYLDVEVKTLPANLHHDSHAHPFDVLALVLDGELSLGTQQHGERRYGVGQVFEMAAHCPHTEVYGPRGVTYLVGRRQPG